MKAIVKLEEQEIEALEKIGDVDCVATCENCPLWVESIDAYVCLGALCNRVLNDAKENE